MPRLPPVTSTTFPLTSNSPEPMGSRTYSGGRRLPVVLGRDAGTSSLHVGDLAREDRPGQLDAVHRLRVHLRREAGVVHRTSLLVVEELGPEVLLEPEQIHQPD